MASDKLITRDGKQLKEIGSWEREQLLKNPIKEFVGKPNKSNCKEEGLQYIYRSENCKGKRPHWAVKIKINCIYYGSLGFFDHKYGGIDGSKIAAIEYRDKRVKELVDQGIIPNDRRKKK